MLLKIKRIYYKKIKIREYLNTFYKNAYISRVDIQRTGKRMIITIETQTRGSGRE